MTRRRAVLSILTAVLPLGIAVLMLGRRRADEEARALEALARVRAAQQAFAAVEPFAGAPSLEALVARDLLPAGFAVEGRSLGVYGGPRGWAVVLAGGLGRPLLAVDGVHFAGRAVDLDELPPPLAAYATARRSGDATAVAAALARLRESPAGDAGLHAFEDGARWCVVLEAVERRRAWSVDEARGGFSFDERLRD